VRAATACMVRARSSLAVRIVCRAWAAACLVQGGGVAESDVLAQIVAFEEDPGLIGEPLGGDPALLGVDADHAQRLPLRTWSTDDHGGGVCRVRRSLWNRCGGSG
jgi:hypothetical protein